MRVDMMVIDNQMPAKIQKGVCWIYSLNLNGIVLYVGVTKLPRIRFWQHLKTTLIGITEVKMVKIEEAPEAHGWDREAHWIRHYKSIGQARLNKTSPRGDREWAFSVREWIHLKGGNTEALAREFGVRTGSLRRWAAGGTPPKFKRDCLLGELENLKGNSYAA